MHPMGEIRKHFWLTLGMAKQCHADLGRALAQGELSQTEYADLVTACRGCDAPHACADWLKAAEENAAPPEYCVNRRRFAELAD